MTSAFDSARFRQVLGHFPTGVTVITAGSGSDKVGLAIGSFFSVSLDPPLVGFCAGKSSSSWPGIREAGRFCVNILAGDHDLVVGRVHDLHVAREGGPLVFFRGGYANLA